MRGLFIALLAALIGVAFVVVTLVHGAERTPPAPAKAAKTLEEITIEGEVRLPEVLFITSRDVERPLDAVAAYLAAEDSLVAALDAAPVRVHVTPAVGSAAPLDPMPTTDVPSPAPVRETQEEPR